MRYIYARRLSSAYQCDPDIVCIPDNMGLQYGDMISYVIPNGKKKIGMYMCESEEKGDCAIVTRYVEVIVNGTGKEL